MFFDARRPVLSSRKNAETVSPPRNSFSTIIDFTYLESNAIFADIASPVFSGTKPERTSPRIDLTSSCVTLETATTSDSFHPNRRAFFGPKPSARPLAAEAGVTPPISSIIFVKISYC